MSANAGNVVIAIQAIDEASGVFGKIQASLGLLGNTLQGLGPGFAQVGSVISGFAVGGPVGAAVAGIGEVVQGLQFSVDAAAKAQTAWTDLQSTLHLSGAAWDAMKTQVDSLLESLRTTTTFSDTALITSFQQLSTYGMTAAQAMDALKAATELAAAKHIDLETAATALGKAFQGNSMLLRRYGIEVATVTQETALGTEAIKEMGVNLLAATGPQLNAFTEAMTAAGLAVNDSTGKMMGHAAVLKEIETAWKGGIIDGSQLSAIVAALGINFQGSKALAMDYANVLGQVNTQFGGAAQAQAGTYAGLQERLGNAVQVLGEKIGSILLPALSGILESLIPIVDGFSKGVGAIQDWIGAIAKIPEVKAATDALGSAFAGLTKYFEDAWNAVSKDLGPALDELWSALKEIWDALKPVWDAFGELMAAFGGSGGSINVLQILLEGLVLVIRGLAEVIRLVVPVVQLFAEGFKAAADLLAPPIKFIVDTVGGFLKWLTDAFQGFYDWLVGHSLWQDLWDTVANIATGVGNTVMGILQGAFDLWKGLFTVGVDAMATILTTGFDLAFAAVQTTVGGAVSVLQGLIQGVVDIIGGSQKSWTDLVASVTTNVQVMKAAIQDLWGWAVPYWKDQVNQIASFMIPRLADIASAVAAATQAMQSNWSNAMEAMVSTTESALQRIYDDMNRQVGAIIARLQAAKDQISSHSIWPDMLNEMVAQTRTGMGAIQDEFGRGLESPGGVIPTIQGAQAAAAGAPTATPTASTTERQAITLPINVYLDGQQIQTFVERRLVDTIIRDAGRSRRT